MGSDLYFRGESNGWRNIGVITYELFHAGTFLDGSLYWMERSEGKILAFVSADEEFRVISPSPCGGFGSYSSLHSLRILGGNLCLVHQQKRVRLDIWSFKSRQQSKYSNNVKEGYRFWSLSLEFSIATPRRSGIYNPFSLTENNEVLLWLDETILCRYDPKTKTLDQLVDLAFDSSVRTCQAVTHLNCLVSLKSLGVNSKRR